MPDQAKVKLASGSGPFYSVLDFALLVYARFGKRSAVFVFYSAGKISSSFERISSGQSVPIQGAITQVKGVHSRLAGMSRAVW